MPNVGTIAICPYYKTEDRYSIICEGIVDIKNAQTKSNIRFTEKAKKDQWIKKHCEAYNYCECPYAKLLDKKYEEEERGNINENNRAKIIICYKKTKT